MLYKLSFLCLNLFVAASFFSPTLRLVFLIPGFLFWILAIIFFAQDRNKLVLEGFLSPLSLIFLFFVLVNFLLKAFYEEGFMVAIKTLFSSYLQWFWMIFFLEFYSSGDELKISPVKILSYTTSIFASVLSFIIILQFLGLVPFAGRHLGILSQPFTSSGILLCALFITLSLLPSDFSFCRSNRMLSRFGFWVLGISAFQIIAILFLGQLSSWFGLILGLLVFISSTRLFFKKQIFAMALMPLCLLTLAYNVSPRIKTKIDRLSSFEHLVENKSIQCRFEIWKINYLLWLEKPILGLKKIMPYNCVLSSKRPATRMTHAHNIYLQNLFHGGLVRFTAWIIFFLTLLFNLLKFRSTWSIPFLSGFLALSLEGFFENWWGDSEVLTLFFLMMLIFNNRAKSACLKS